MNIIKTFNWIDIVIIILLIRACYIGSKAGLTIELQRIAGLILGFIVSYFIYKQLGQFISQNSFISANWAEILSFIVVIIACSFAFKLLTVLLSKILKFQFKPQIEKIFGGILGVSRGLFLASVVLVTLNMMPSNYIRESITGRSLSGCYVIKIATGSYNFFIKFFPVG